MKTTCSILVVNWNSWDLLGACLESLSKQTYRDFRVFVADNASDHPPPDGMFSIIPHTVFVQNNRNLGFAAANNQLIYLAKDSEWIVLLNPDAFPDCRWLEQLMNSARENDDYASFTSRLLCADNKNKLDGEGDAYHVSGLAWRSNHGCQVYENVLPREVFSACAAAAMYRTDVLLESGGFDEDFFCYFEDVDLGFRLGLFGNHCLFVPSAVVYHVGSGTTGGAKSDFSLYHGHRNLVWAFVKNMPGLLLIIFLPLHLLINIGSLIWFSLQGRGKVILRAKWDAVKGIPKAWRQRTGIQSARKVPVRDILRRMDKRLGRLVGMR